MHDTTTHFADQAQSIQAPILENVVIAKSTRRLRIEAPEMARRVVPGQFFMVRNPYGNDPLIGRAFALYDVDANAGWIDLVYLVKGKLTTSLALLDSSDRVAVWGPLGNGFPPQTAEHLIMVAGGIGQTPFLTLARESLGSQTFGPPSNSDTQRSAGQVQRVSLYYGARTQDYLAGLDDFRQAGVELQLATEDGSAGINGRVTDALVPMLDEARAAGTSVQIVCCGPELMMEAVAKIAITNNLPCQVSLETPMACGIGICFSCVAKIGAAEDWDYKRTCVDGPVFDARKIVW